MTYVILPDLQIILFFVFFIIENFEKVFIYHLAMSYVIIYHITIILNILDKVANCIEFRIVEGWLI